MRDRLNSEILSAPENYKRITLGLELEFKFGWLVLAWESEAVIGSSNFQDLRNILNGKAEGQGLLAVVLRESLVPKLQRDEGNMTAVHRLDRDAFLGDIDVDILDQIFDGVDDFSETGALFESCDEH